MLANFSFSALTISGNLASEQLYVLDNSGLWTSSKEKNNNAWHNNKNNENESENKDGSKDGNENKDKNSNKKMTSPINSTTNSKINTRINTKINNLYGNQPELLKAFKVVNNAIKWHYNIVQNKAIKNKNENNKVNPIYGGPNSGM